MAGNVPGGPPIGIDMDPEKEHESENPEGRSAVTNSTPHDAHPSADNNNEQPPSSDARQNISGVAGQETQNSLDSSQSRSRGARVQLFTESSASSSGEVFQSATSVTSVKTDVVPDLIRSETDNRQRAAVVGQTGAASIEYLDLSRTESERLAIQHSEHQPMPSDVVGVPNRDEYYNLDLAEEDSLDPEDPGLRQLRTPDGTPETGDEASTQFYNHDSEDLGGDRNKGIPMRIGRPGFAPNPGGASMYPELGEDLRSLMGFLPIQPVRNDPDSDHHEANFGPVSFDLDPNVIRLHAGSMDGSGTATGDSKSPNNPEDILHLEVAATPPGHHSGYGQIDGEEGEDDVFLPRQRSVDENDLEQNEDPEENAYHQDKILDFGEEGEEEGQEIEYEDNTEVDQDVVLQPEADQSGYDDEHQVLDPLRYQVNTRRIVPDQQSQPQPRQPQLMMPFSGYDSRQYMSAGKHYLPGKNGKPKNDHHNLNPEWIAGDGNKAQQHMPAQPVHLKGNPQEQLVAPEGRGSTCSRQVIDLLSAGSAQGNELGAPGFSRAGAVAPRPTQSDRNQQKSNIFKSSANTKPKPQDVKPRVPQSNDTHRPLEENGQQRRTKIRTVLTKGQSSGISATFGHGKSNLTRGKTMGLKSGPKVDGSKLRQQPQNKKDQPPKRIGPSGGNAATPVASAPPVSGTVPQGIQKQRTNRASGSQNQTSRQNRQQDASRSPFRPGQGVESRSRVPMEHWQISYRDQAEGVLRPNPIGETDGGIGQSARPWQAIATQGGLLPPGGDSQYHHGLQDLSTSHQDQDDQDLLQDSGIPSRRQVPTGTAVLQESSNFQNQSATVTSTHDNHNAQSGNARLIHQVRPHGLQHQSLPANQSHPDHQDIVGWDRSLELSPISRASGVTERSQFTSHSPGGTGVRDVVHNLSFSSSVADKAHSSGVQGHLGVRFDLEHTAPLS